ncbi:MAG: hypothetical protein ACKVXR_03875 [Planctomycetota bacterium]
MVVSDVRLTDAASYDVRRGLIGFVSCVLNDTVRLEGLTLRRTRKGQTAISFPTRRDAHGREHAIVRLLRSDDRRSIEAQIFSALGIEQKAAP